MPESSSDVRAPLPRGSVGEGGTPGPRIGERRRSPRFGVFGGELAVLPISLSVRLLDISLTGVLVHSSQTAKEGARGQLRLDVAGRPFAAEVEIRRIAQGPEGRGYKIGARFVDLTEDQRHVIEGFIRR